MEVFAFQLRYLREKPATDFGEGFLGKILKI
jgi:hypothetical protein